MPAGNDKVLSIPILNDFIYTILYEATYEQKRGLKGKYLQAAVDCRSAKLFASMSTREEKEYILSYFGFQYFYVVAPKDVKFAELKEKLKQFKSEHKVRALKNVAEEGFYVHGDEQFMYLLRLMAKSMHHPSFFLNLELIRQGFHIKKWTKRNFNKKDMDVRETMENDSLLIRTLLSGNLSVKYVPGLTGLTEVEMNILMYFYVYKHTFITEETLKGYFLGVFTKREFQEAVVALVKTDYIRRKAHNVMEYTITSPGIQAVADYRDTVLANNQF